MLSYYDVLPGDMVEVKNGTRGAVTAVCRFATLVIAVEVGFEWHSISDVVSWTPNDYS